MKNGQTVFSKKLYWANVSGELVKKQTGKYSGLQSFCTELTWRKAARTYRCEDCYDIISKGQMHGGTFYSHLCEKCVTEAKPETQFKEHFHAQA